MSRAFVGLGAADPMAGLSERMRDDIIYTLGVSSGMEDDRWHDEWTLRDVEYAIEQFTDPGRDDRWRGSDLALARRWLVAHGVYGPCDSNTIEWRHGRGRPVRAEFKIDGTGYCFREHRPEPSRAVDVSEDDE